MAQHVRRATEQKKGTSAVAARETPTVRTSSERAAYDFAKTAKKEVPSPAEAGPLDVVPVGIGWVHVSQTPPPMRRIVAITLAKRHAGHVHSSDGAIAKMSCRNGEHESDLG